MCVKREGRKVMFFPGKREAINAPQIPTCAIRYSRKSNPLSRVGALGLGTFARS